jgi:hypothetical protein
MKFRHTPVLYLVMTLSAFAAGFHYLDQISPPQPPKAAKSEIASAEISEATLADIRKSLEKKEYEISYDVKNEKLQSPNRSNNLRAYYEPGKLTIQTRVDTTGEGFKMELVNDGVFADGKLLYVPEARAKADYHENKVQISHRAFTEEFINNEYGVRQNFIVETAPEGTRQLQVKMTVKGLKVAEGSCNELRFYSEKPDGQTRNELVYSDLKCWDAKKQPLNATLAYMDNQIQISVDVANAAYPVTIDPIIANGTPQNANKVLEVNQSGMHLGSSVSSAGDVNGDGYSDVIVGAPSYDKGQNFEGAAFVYKGGPSGLTLTAVTLEANQADAMMGNSVASAGDFNGDGFSDVLVGAPFYDNHASQDGIAKLYLGSATFFTSSATSYVLGNDHAGAKFGSSVATAGDVNGDGFSDVLIGASNDSNGQSKEGSVTLCYGSANGDLSSNFVTLEINQANAIFGASLAGAGDVDADGYSDIIVGASNYTNGQGQKSERTVFIYRGSSSGLITNNPTIMESAGSRVTSAGDVNGDGYSDVLLSTAGYDGPDPQLVNQGIVNLHLGSPTGIDPIPHRSFYGGQQLAEMGSSIACAGDVNGDGYSDILLGARYYGQSYEGAVFVYHGSKDGITGGYASMLKSNQADAWFGIAVASAGDVNGDGYSDIMIGCEWYDNGQTDEGLVFIYHGGAEGIGTNESLTLTNGKTGAQMGLSIATAGDVNADGYSDVVVGAPYFDDGQAGEGAAFVYYGSVDGLTTINYHKLHKGQANAYFGGSVAGAGDINGDGYDDVIVGAKNYSAGESEEGAVFIYYGSNSGVDPNASLAGLQVNKASAHLGFTVAGAGDVNRDGYADFIAGAPTYTNTGNVFLYYGSSQTIGNPVSIQGPQNDKHFGEAIAAAGDVNGDGFADIIIGAWAANYGQQGEGAAYIYHGSPGAFNVSPTKTLEINQNDANFGFSVASAGDANGDGYSDVIIGSRYYDYNELNEGAAFVYYGTVSGISESSPAPTRLEANRANAYFGSSVNSAGDVNGDGYSDVIVGAPNFTNGETNEGNVYVFDGSPIGIKKTSSFSNEGNIADNFAGKTVASAGDVNGDGYSDILVGLPGSDNGQAVDAGAVLLYYGNNGKGIRNNVRLYNDNLVSPISQSQLTKTNFGLGLFMKSFIGTNRGQLVFETVSNGNSFSKSGTNPITTSTQSSGQSPLTTLAAIGTENISLANKPAGVATRVRARVRYSPVLALTGQMYGPWRYVQRQLAGYNNAPVPEEAMTETTRMEARPEVETSVSLFPNPASDRLSIQVADPSDIHGVRLYNTSGTPVFQSPRYERDIDVSRLPGGIYILMLNRAYGTSTSHRILIRR